MASKGGILRSLCDGAGHQIARHICRIHASPPYCLPSDIRWKAEKVESIGREKVFPKHIRHLFKKKVVKDVYILQNTHMCWIASFVAFALEWPHVLREHNGHCRPKGWSI